MPQRDTRPDEVYNFFVAAERSGRVLNVRGEIDSYMVHALAYLEGREVAPPAYPNRLLEIMRTAVIASQRAADLYAVYTLALLCNHKAARAAHDRPAPAPAPAPAPTPVPPEPEPAPAKPTPKPPKPVKPTKPLI